VHYRVRGLTQSGTTVAATRCTKGEDKGEPVHILDALSDPQYAPKDDIQKANVRTILGVPLTREGKVAGVIALARETVSSFSDEQIELVRNLPTKRSLPSRTHACSRNCAKEPTSCKCSRRNSPD
jgi:signal transduction protein with GAF and PtsI domain